MQKAFAIEMAMVKQIYKALENKDQDLALMEFKELPYRLKSQVYLILSKTLFPDVEPEIEKGRKSLFDLDDALKVPTDVKANCFKDLESKMLQSYIDISDAQIFGLLQQDFRDMVEGTAEKEKAAHTALAAAQKKEEELFEILRSTHRIAHTALVTLHQKMQNQKTEIENASRKIKTLDLKLQGKTQIENQIESLRKQYEAVIQNLKEDKKSLQESNNSLQERLLQVQQTQLVQSLNESSIDSLGGSFLMVAKTSPLDRFADFVSTRSPQYSFEQVKTFIQRGETLVTEIQNGRANSIGLSQRAEMIAEMVWYMLYCAVCEDQEFSQGTFVVRDPGHAIFKFFQSTLGMVGGAAPRDSTHFADRILPSYSADGKKIVKTYGIDVKPSEKKGLPANMRTVNFAAIETIDGFDWSFFKPEAHGVEDWTDFMMHAWDYVKTRPARWMKKADGPNEYREHLPLEVEKGFFAVTKGSNLPPVVKKFGISGIFSELHKMCKDSNVPQETKKKITTFLHDLSQKYNHLEVRKGNEVVLGDSFLDGSITKSQDIININSLTLEQLKLNEALARVKNAAHDEELSCALSALKEMKTPLLKIKEGFVDDVASMFKMNRQDPKSPFNKQAIFDQINKDLERSKKNLKFTVDDKKFNNPDELYDYLCGVEPFVSIHSKDKEQAVLRFMALLQQGPVSDLWAQAKDWFEQHHRGIGVYQRVPTRQELENRTTITSIEARTGKDPTIEVKQPFFLQCADLESKLFEPEKRYVVIEGVMKTDFNSQTLEMKANLLDC
jgi:hypothetical protein